MQVEINLKAHCNGMTIKDIMISAFLEKRHNIFLSVADNLHRNQSIILQYLHEQVIHSSHFYLLSTKLS